MIIEVESIFATFPRDCGDTALLLWTKLDAAISGILVLIIKFVLCFGYIARFTVCFNMSEPVK